MARKGRGRRRGGVGAVHGILPIAAALGVTAGVIANPSTPALPSLLRGDVVNFMNNIGATVQNPAVVSGLVPGLIFTGLALVLHKKFGRATRITKHWAAI